MGSTLVNVKFTSFLHMYLASEDMKISGDKFYVIFIIHNINKVTHFCLCESIRQILVKNFR